MKPLVISGEGAAAGFIAAAEDQFTETLGFRPFHGTLNLDASGTVVEFTDRMPWTRSEHCDGIRYRRCYVSGVRAAVIRPIVPDYPDEKYEVVAPVKLRSLFAIGDGDPVTVDDHAWNPDGLATNPGGLDEFDAVVFDFDGTLAELAVEWTTVQEAITETLDPYLEKSLRKYEQGEILRIARENDVYDDVETILRTHEVDAVDSSTARTELELLRTLDRPIGICTMNALDAVTGILERFGVADDVDVIAARETMEATKPDPRPLQYCLERLDASPGNAVFVGDQSTDALAAENAGTSFLHPDQLGDDA